MWDAHRFSTSVQDGDKFWRMPECYIRGSTIKYLRIPDEVIDMVKEEVVAKGRGRGDGKGGRGGGGGGGSHRGGRGGSRGGELTWNQHVAFNNPIIYSIWTFNLQARLEHQEEEAEEVVLHQEVEVEVRTNLAESEMYAKLPDLQVFGGEEKKKSSLKILILRSI